MSWTLRENSTTWATNCLRLGDQRWVNSSRRCAPATLVFLSGHGLGLPEGGFLHLGKLGADLTVEQGYDCARQVMLNLLASLKEEIGDLDKVKRVVKLLCMINAAPDFGDTPKVANGASDLLVELYGEAGQHARSAVGMATLPSGMPVEIEMVVEVED